MAIYYGDGSNSNTGRIIQVVQATYSSAAVQSSGTNDVWYDLSGMSASIAPKDSNNKVLIMAHINGWHNWDSAIRILRGASTVVGGGSNVGARISAIMEYPKGGRTNEAGNCSFQWLDSPASTSSQTYKLQFNWRGNTIYFNRSQNDDNNTSDARTTSTLTLIEVAV